MSVIQIDAWQCDLCGHVWYTKADDPPKACAKCKRRNWDRPFLSKRPEQPAVPIKVARAIPKPQAESPKASATIEDDGPICEYTEYVSDIGETYRCNLSLGHKSKHRMGAQVS